MRPRPGELLELGDERIAREFELEYVQLGRRVLVELRELDQCVATRHVPVLRVEETTRRSRGFVAWDFVLGAAAGGFAGLAYARPQAFTKPLIDSEGQLYFDNTGGYVIGGVFTALAVGLLSAGVVNALRARDSVTYAEAYTLERGEPHPCAGSGDGAGGRPLGERELTLFVGEGVLDASARSDASGRARFELPPWPPELPGGMVPAVLEIARAEGEGAEPKLLEFELRVPFDQPGDAITGRVSTRAKASSSAEPAAVEGPQP